MMKICRKIIYVLISLIILALVGGYSFVIFGLPKILNSEKYITKYEDILEQKLGVPFVIKGFNFSIKPDLKFSISIEEIVSDKIIQAKKLGYSANLLNLKHGEFAGEDFFVDINKLKNHIKPSENKNKFNFSFLPVANIKNVYIKIAENSFIKIDYIFSEKIKNEVVTRVYGSVKTPGLKSPLIFGKQGYISYKKDWGIENFSVQSLNSKLFLTGNAKKLKISAKDLPAKELESAFIFYYKFKHPNKKNFIENFSDFSGMLDVDLTIEKGNFNGTCTTKELRALFYDFKIPVYLPKTVFYFKDKDVKASTSGTFGFDPVKTDFYLTGIATKDVLVTGNVISPLTNKTAKKYYPLVGIVGKTDALVKYKTHNEVVDIDYIATINKGNDLKIASGNLGNTNKIRQIKAHTQKIGDKITLKNYEYSFLGEKRFIWGDGFFEKIGSKYKPKFITLKTQENTPAYAISSLVQDYLHNGTFSANLKYDFIKDQIEGVMNLYNISHEDFLFLKEANINIDKNNILFKTHGSFYGSKMRAAADIKNNFNKKIVIHNIDVYLDEFFVQSGDSNEQAQDENDSDFTIPIDVEHGSVAIHKIYGNKFDVYNAKIEGNLLNNVANFIIPQAQYAGGLLSAKGIYDMNDYSSDIQFFASDIDSNVVVTKFFMLPDYVKGSAFATLHVITKDKLNDIKAKATFAISEGGLPKLASHEFMIKLNKNKKQPLVVKLIKKMYKTLSLSKIVTNFDFSKPGSSVVYGSFNLDNDSVNNVRLFTKSEMISSFIEGDYNVESQCGNLAIWGKRNKTLAKDIRIFKIPLNWIYKFIFKPEYAKDVYKAKLDLVPDLDAGSADVISVFRILVSGNLNDIKKLKVELKDLR